MLTWHSVSCAAGYLIWTKKPPESDGAYISYINILYEIVYDVVYDTSNNYIRYRIRCRIRCRMRHPLKSLMIPCFALCRQASGRHGRGRLGQNINLHLLKPARFRPNPEWALPPADRDGVVHDEALDPEPDWMTYEYRTAHPVLMSVAGVILYGCMF